MDKELDEKSKYIMKKLKDNYINYEVYEHEPIFSYEVAEEVSKRLGFTGTESKSLFLKSKDDKYFIYLTIQGEMVDFKKLKEILKTKVSICSSKEMTDVIGCYPGCVSPFGHNKEITIIVDSKVFEQEKLIFSPGVPNKTIIVKLNDLRTIFEILDNEIVFL